MIYITLNNNKGRIEGDLKQCNAVRNAFKLKHPKAFFMRQKMKNSHGWDGFIYYVNDNGYFKSGLFPLIIKYIEENKIPYEVKDDRHSISIDTLAVRVGTYELRPEQKQAVQSILYNKVGGIMFQRGIINAATNAGKTLIMMSIFYSLRNVKGVILLNNSELFNQFLRDMPKYFDQRDWGYMRGKEIKMADFMIVMVQTLINNLDKYKNWLEQVEVVFVDECDLSTNKTYTKILEKLYNSTIRVGLSGSVFLSNLKRDAMKNMELQTFLGPEVFRIKNEELIKKKVSVPIVVKINKGNNRLHRARDYDEEYRQGISLNPDRHLIIANRCKYYLKQEFTPILVMCQYHEHVESLFEVIKINLGLDYKVSFIHGDVPERDQRLNRFREGKIDILVSSMIIKRGQNLPLVKVIINAAGGDSAANVLQLLGRGTRTDPSKTRTYLEDFYDMGTFLKRHSNHRLVVYKNEGFKIISHYLNEK